MTATIQLQKRFKPLLTRINNKAGRSHGRITVRHRGFLSTRLYRFVDYKRIVFPNSTGLVLREQYNHRPRNHLALICFSQGIFTNIILPSKVKAGDFIQNYTSIPKKSGDSAPIMYLPSGGLIHNLSTRPRGSGIMIRSSGCSAILVRKDINLALLKLKSGELRYFETYNTATLGSVGDESNFLMDHKKAGMTRHLGKRPRVRPSAMNPVDHPMGGRTRGGFQPTNPKGRITAHTSTKRYYDIHTGITQRQLKFKKA
jgi:large subunit ribosomal protein L2